MRAAFAQDGTATKREPPCSYPWLGALLKCVVMVSALSAAACTRGPAPGRDGQASASPPAHRFELPPASKPAPTAQLSAPAPRVAPNKADEVADLPYLDPSQDPDSSRPPGPRCSSKEATCLPIPHNGDPRLRVGEKETPYDPKAKRRAVKGWTSTDKQDACKHDGDCMLKGCGNSCVGWNHDVGASVCIAHSELHEAYCGCIAKFCGWFTLAHKGPRPPE